MRRLLAVVVLLAGAAGIAAAADQPMESEAKPGVYQASTMHAKGTVEDIDYDKRTVTLKGDNGELVTLEIGAGAKRFNEVKKGDIVKIDYLESVGVMVQPPSESTEHAMGSQSVLVRGKGTKPSGVMVRTDIVTATVEKIDAKKRLAVVKGPEGNSVHIHVAPDVPNLENVKVGDQVVVKFTRQLGLSVHKP
jgi:Cu/Ag efflux protein CusF